MTRSAPVIAFNTGGLPDIVEHQRTGYLAKAFDTEDLAHGFAWVLAQRETGRLGKQARERAETRCGASGGGEVSGGGCMRIAES